MKFRVRSSEFGVKASTMPKRMFFPNSELNDSELPLNRIGREHPVPRGGLFISIGYAQ